MKNNKVLYIYMPFVPTLIYGNIFTVSVSYLKLRSTR